MKKGWFLIVGATVLVVTYALFRFSDTQFSLQRVADMFSWKQKPVVLGFAGDMMFDRYVRQKADARGYDSIFADVFSLLSAHDAVIANLEGPITVFDSVSLGSMPMDQNNYTFTFSEHVAKALARANISIVSVGNNHIFNFGNQGLSQTRQFLTDAGVSYFGAPFSENVLVRDFGTVRVAFVAFNEFLPPTPNETIHILARLATSTDVIIVFSHWGYEYEKEPNGFQKELARKFIDAGADFVVGAHPHVVQTHETYNGKEIYYSLGNFVFDQYWSDDVRCGLFVTLTINPKDFSYTTTETTVYLEKDGTTVQKECGQIPQIMQSSPQTSE